MKQRLLLDYCQLGAIAFPYMLPIGTYRMSHRIDLAALLAGCADDSFADGIRIDSQLEPLSGSGGLVKPAVYEGGTYQRDRRWASPADGEPTQVIVIDNVPSQANRLEEALRRSRDSTLIPEFVLDLSEPAESPFAPASNPVEPRVSAPQCGCVPSRRATGRAGFPQD